MRRDSMRQKTTAKGALVAALAALMGGCGLEELAIPPFSGPSQALQALKVSANPDLLLADGESTSIITAQMLDANGRGVPGRTIAFIIADEEGRIAEIGRISTATKGPGPAATAVTDGNGIAQATYRAPFRHEVSVDTTVTILTRPVGTDANAAMYSSVQIELRSPEGRTNPQDPDNDSPVCSFLVDPPIGPYFAGQTLLFRSTSVDPDGRITAYFWSFGDGTTENKPETYHAYGLAGSYTVTHIVTDDDGARSSCAAAIRVQ
jgi:chitodextrinase